MLSAAYAWHQDEGVHIPGCTSENVWGYCVCIPCRPVPAGCLPIKKFPRPNKALFYHSHFIPCRPVPAGCLPIKNLLRPAAKKLCLHPLPPRPGRLLAYQEVSATKQGPLLSFRQSFHTFSPRPGRVLAYQEPSPTSRKKVVIASLATPSRQVACLSRTFSDQPQKAGVASLARPIPAKVRKKCPLVATPPIISYIRRSGRGKNPVLAA